MRRNVIILGLLAFMLLPGLALADIVATPQGIQSFSTPGYPKLPNSSNPPLFYLYESNPNPVNLTWNGSVFPLITDGILSLGVYENSVLVDLVQFHTTPGFPFPQGIAQVYTDTALPSSYTLNFFGDKDPRPEGYTDFIVQNSMGQTVVTYRLFTDAADGAEVPVPPSMLLLGSGLLGLVGWRIKKG